MRKVLWNGTQTLAVTMGIFFPCPFHESFRGVFFLNFVSYFHFRLSNTVCCETTVHFKNITDYSIPDGITSLLPDTCTYTDCLVVHQKNSVDFFCNSIFSNRFCHCRVFTMRTTQGHVTMRVVKLKTVKNSKVIRGSTAMP